jgi:histidinol phosphatase-like enzyme
MTRRDLFEPTPIPGTGPQPRGLFVSRSSGLLDKAPRSGALRFDPARFSADALPALFSAGQAGWKIYLIGNEESVARGRTSLAAWERFESALMGHLKSHGVPVVRHYACLDHPQGTGNHKRDSVFLFPNTGALYHAAQEDGILLAESWLVSSDPLELAAGWRAGCRTASLDMTPKLRAGRIEVETSTRTQRLSVVVREIIASNDLARR